MNNFNQQSYFAPMTGIRSTNNIIWVQGIEGAKAWQLAPAEIIVIMLCIIMMVIILIIE